MKRTASSRLRTTTLPFRVKCGSNLNSVIALSLLLSVRIRLFAQEITRVQTDLPDHIIRRQRPPDPLQLELADRLDLHGVLDLRQHASTNKDLSGLGFIAKPRGDIG